MSFPPGPPPESLSDEDLLALISGRYQEAHRRLLPELIALARKVEAVHEGVDGVPVGLADALDRISLELDMHMGVEEKVLFPAMLRHLGGAIGHPIAQMRSEHQGYAAELGLLSELTHGFAPPEGACGSWRRLYAGVAQLCASLGEQMRLENEVLFPRFEQRTATGCICAQS